MKTSFRKQVSGWTNEHDIAIDNIYHNMPTSLQSLCKRDDIMIESEVIRYAVIELAERIKAEAGRKPKSQNGAQS